MDFLSNGQSRTSRLVVFLGVTNLALLVLAYLPALLFSENSHFVHGFFFDYLNISSRLLATIIITAAVAVLILPRIILRNIAPIVVFCFLYSFILGIFVTPLTVDIGLLDGTDKELRIGTTEIVVELVLGILVLGLIWRWYEKTEPFFMKFFSIVSVLIIGYVGFVSSAAIQPKVVSTNKTSAFAIDEFLQFSNTENVLVVLLDTLSSDFLLALLDRTPNLSLKLDGFTFFQDVAGVSPTTYLAMPTIHSGQYISPSKPFRQAYTELIGKKSFLTAAARSGAKVHLLNPIFNCPDKVSCGKSEDLLANNFEAIVQDWNLLVDISLFRVSPHAFKSAVFNDGKWILSAKKLEKNPLHVESYRDNRVMREFSKRLHVGDSQPRVKFMHLFNTHYPYNVGPECEIVEEDNSSLEIALNAARCGIEGLVSIIESLKEKDIYDSMLIVLLADHGSHLNYVGHSTADRIQVDKSWKFQLRTMSETKRASLPRTPNRAHPILAVKRPQDRGRLNIDKERAVSLTDIYATVCANTPLCDQGSGINAFEAPAASSRDRFFNDYIWKSEFWGADNLEKDIRKLVIDYSMVDGDVFDRVPGEKFYFNQIGFNFNGFGAAEKWGRWTNDRSADFEICFAEPITDPLVMVMGAVPFVTEHARIQNVKVRIKDETVLKLVFEYGELNNSGTELRVKLYPRYLDNRGCVQISFELPDAVLPEGAGSGDKRLLALGLEAIFFETLQ